MSKLKIQIIIGSVRPTRFADKPAQWLLGFLNQDERFEAELVDVRDYPLPLFDQAKSPVRVADGQYGNEVANRWARKIAEADGYVMVTGEYNHGYPAALKNALDWIYAEWVRKPVTFVAYGNAGGARAVEQLRQVAIELQLAPIKAAVHLPGPLYMALRNEVAPVAAQHFAPVETAAKAMRDDLAWWANALREARKALPFAELRDASSTRPSS